MIGCFNYFEPHVSWQYLLCSESDMTQLKALKLKFLGVLFRLLGLFPVKKTKNGYEIKWFSWSGAWCVMLALLHLLCAQTYIGVRYLIYISEDFNHTDLEGRATFVCWVILHLFSNGGHIVWLLSIQKLVKVWNELENYSQNFGLTQSDAKRISLGWNFGFYTLAWVAYFPVWVLNSESRLKYLEENNGTSWSLLFYLMGNSLGVRIVCMIEALVRYAPTLAAHAAILIYSTAISGRVLEICMRLDNVIKNSENPREIFVRSPILSESNSGKPETEMMELKARATPDQIYCINKIFQSFLIAFQNIFLFYTGHGFFAFAVFTFGICQQLLQKYAAVEASFIGLLLGLVGILASLVITSNSAYYLQNSVSTYFEQA